MSYCEAVTKATVNYNFNGINPKTYTTELTPIEVDISEKFTPSFVGGQCPVQHWIDYNVTHIFDNGQLLTVYYDGVLNRIPVYGKILNIFTNKKIGESSGNYNSLQGLSITYLDYRTNEIRGLGLTATSQIPAQPNQVHNASLTLVGYQVTSVRAVDGVSNNCGEPKTLGILKVLHKGKTIFTDRGDIPINFKVVCGEDCPENTIKCQKSGYPGYCCIPCGSVKSEISVIKSMIRSIVDG